MAATRVADFFASLGLRVDSRSFNTAETGLNRVRGAVTKFLAVSSVLLTGRALAGVVSEVTETGDRLGKLSIGLGISTDALQTFEFAAQRSGVGASEFNNALGKIPKKIADAVGSAGPMVQTFRDLGTSAEALQKLSPEDQFLAIADGFKNINSDSKRTVAALRLFEETGAKFIPLLREGKEGIQALGDELTRFGGRLSKDTIQASEDWQDSLTNLGSVMRGIKTQLTVALLPSLNVIVDKLVELGEQGTLTAAFEKVIQAVKALGAIAAVVGIAMAIAFAPALLAMAPMIIAVGALVLLYDEIITTLEGGDSVFNDFLKWLGDSESKSKVLNVALTPLRFIFGGMGDAIAVAVEAMKDMVFIVEKFLTLKLGSGLSAVGKVASKLGFGFEGSALSLVGSSITRTGQDLLQAGSGTINGKGKDSQIVINASTNITANTQSAEQTKDAVSKGITQAVRAAKSVLANR